MNQFNSESFKDILSLDLFKSSLTQGWYEKYVGDMDKKLNNNQAGHSTPYILGSHLRGHAMDIIVTPHATLRVQCRFPKTRKKRIMKKWRKQEKNFKYEPTCFMINGNQLVVPPGVAYEINKGNL
jgi:hypothetical protein